MLSSDGGAPQEARYLLAVFKHIGGDLGIVSNRGQVPGTSLQGHELLSHSS